MSLYDYIRRRFAEAIVTVSEQLKQASDREASGLREGVRDAVRAAAQSMQDPFDGAPVAAGKSLGVIIECADATGKSARPEVSLARTV